MARHPVKAPFLRMSQSGTRTIPGYMSQCFTSRGVGTLQYRRLEGCDKLLWTLAGGLSGRSSIRIIIPVRSSGPCHVVSWSGKALNLGPTDDLSSIITHVSLRVTATRSFAGPAALQLPARISQQHIFHVNSYALAIIVLVGKCKCKCKCIETHDAGSVILLRSSDYVLWIKPLFSAALSDNPNSVLCTTPIV
jgi:hypothetical protein